MKQVGTVLAGYDDDVIEYVTAPQTGLQRTQKFAPVLAEIVEACNARVKAIAHQAELDAWRERKRKSDEIKRVGGPRHSAVERPGLMNYGQMEAYCKERGIQFKPMGRFDSVAYRAGTREQDEDK